MKKTTCLFLLLTFAVYVHSQATIRIEKERLMNEMRSIPYPLDGSIVKQKNIAFMWALPASDGSINTALDGFEKASKKKPTAGKINYKIRLSQDPILKKGVVVGDCVWAFYNPQITLKQGKWYWQYGYVHDKETTWSKVLEFTVDNLNSKFDPPHFNDFIKKVPVSHPRILVFEKDWDSFIKNSAEKHERSWFLEKAKGLVDNEIKNIAQTIDTSKVAGLDSQIKKHAMLTRESRRIVDREEANTEVLIRSYVLTKDIRYLKSAMKHITEMISWKKTPYLVGDFNQATLLSLSSLAYDSFYDDISEAERQMLLNEIKENGTELFNGFTNHLEAHIADNHVWQMNLRIFTMAAFAVYGDLKEADQWVDYAYNIWLARFPGLNQDGAWHNGDSYFHVNMRTLIEVPYFYSRISGYDFFSDPWYQGSALYVMYQQPPFSKSAGNGSAHLRVVKPSGVRVGYADALARLTQNGYLSDYVSVIKTEEPKILRKAFMAKPGDLSWFRLLNDIPLPKNKALAELPLSHIFPQTGLATFMSDWAHLKENAMLSFRSSPYGSTSHALANQNSFNTFYAGEPLFYSSGHHISFTDEHSIYSHRSTRAHNTILVDGMGQKIGTEGYGWIPRHYTGQKVSYLVGDASNAYGKVISPLWLKRGEESGLEYSPKNGWGENNLKTFRRHIVELDGADLVFIYDELEAYKPVTWDYLLHTVSNPMQVQKEADLIHVTATNGNGVSDAYLLSKDKLELSSTDKFFYPAINWLRADDNGNFLPYNTHWHFKATSPKSMLYRFGTIINTHSSAEKSDKPRYVADDTIELGNWIITMNLTATGKANFSIKNKSNDITIIYDDATRITENGRTSVLIDQVPDLEI